MGVGVPLSGDAAWLGDNVLSGIKLYLKEHQLEFKNIIEIEDVSATNNGAGVSAVQKLINQEGVAALILCVSPVVSAVAPLIDQKEIPTVAIVGSETARNRKYQVRLWPRPDDEMSLLRDSLKGKRIAVLYAEQESMLARKDSLVNTLDLTTEIVFSSTLDLQSLNSVILKLVKSNPQTVVLFLMPGQYGLAAKKMRELKFSGQIAGSAIMNAQEDIVLSRGALDGASFPDVFMTDEFINNYKQEYGKFPGPGAAPGYDAAKLIVKGLENSNNDHEQLNAALHPKSFTGAMGHYGILNDGSNNFQIPLILHNISSE